MMNLNSDVFVGKFQTSALFMIILASCQHLFMSSLFHPCYLHTILRLRPLIL